VDRVVIPERSGYYIGARMVEAALEQRGATWAIRASAEDLLALGTQQAATA
jgi:hypothetical protein